MKTYNETRVNLTGVIKSKANPTTNAEEPLLNPDGTHQTEDLNNVTEKKANDILEFHKKQGWPEPQVAKIQTFEYTEPETIAEIEPLFVQAGLDPTVAAARAVDVFNRGWAIEQQGEIRSFMAKSDPVEGVFSLLADAAQPAERRVKDPLTTAANALKKAGFNVTLDDLKSLMGQFAAPAPTQEGVGATPQAIAQ